MPGQHKQGIIEINPEAAETMSFAHDPLVITMGSFKFEYSSIVQRCNIMNTETMDTGFIKLKDSLCGGDVEFIQKDNLTWNCASWELDVVLPIHIGGVMVIELHRLGVRIQLHS